MKDLFITFLITIYIISNSCDDNSVNKNKNKISNFQKGKIVDKEICSSNPTQSYSYYLPSSYNSEFKYPVIFIFDARGRGKLGVNRFSKAAEKFGFILIGSLNSKNGQSIESGIQIYDHLLDDVTKKFSIDKRRIYTAGFSGGSRVAASIAIQRGGIHSVIGLSAGLPKMDKPIQQRFHYIGFAGQKDFNYYEMKAVETAFEKAQLNHHLIIFDGIHDWPTSDTLETALLWAECMAVKDKLVPIKENLLLPAFKYDKEIFDVAMQNKDFIKSYILAEKILHFYREIYDISTIDSTFTILKENKIIIGYLKKLDELDNKVRMLEEEFSSSFNKKLDWWKIQITPLRAQQKSTKDKDLSASYDRLFSYLGLVAFSGANDYMSKKQWDIAQHFLEIYKLVEPKNPEYAYQYARYYILTHKADFAIESLKVADNLNFDDFEKISSDTLFNILIGKTEFDSLLNNIKSRSL